MSLQGQQWVSEQGRRECQRKVVLLTGQGCRWLVNHPGISVETFVKCCSEPPAWGHCLLLVTGCPMGHELCTSFVASVQVPKLQASHREVSEKFWSIKQDRSEPKSPQNCWMWSSAQKASVVYDLIAVLCLFVSFFLLPTIMVYLTTDDILDLMEHNRLVFHR